jgi:hypothetical protein
MKLEQIDYIEVIIFYLITKITILLFKIGPNEQFFRINTVKHSKLRCLTTGCAELTR